MIYIKRQMEKAIIEASKQFPVIMVCGQRQTGKSTMLMHIKEEDRIYVSFDDFKVRQLALNDPDLFFETYGHKLIIDEFQLVPSILASIKKIVDEYKINNKDYYGMFWLSGSQKFKMMKGVSESLAGRVAIFNLLPLSFNELNGDLKDPFNPNIETLKNKNIKKITLNECFKYIYDGGLPDLVVNKLPRELYFSSYMDTFIERDISRLENVGKLDEFRRFVVYMAANTAQELKYDKISKEIGVSAPTIKEWVSILERSGIIYILRPYYNSLIKRLVKTPKCYFIDTGLASYLTSWPSSETLMNGSMSGAFFETFIVSEILKGYRNNGIEPNLYYYRDIDQKEIDLMFINGKECYPIEIKKGKEPSFNLSSFNVLNKLNLKINPILIICSIDTLYPFNKDIWYCPFEAI